MSHSKRLSQSDFCPKSWRKSGEQIAKDSIKHALIIQTSQVITEKVRDCLEQADNENRSPLQLIAEGFMEGEASAFNQHIKQYDSRTWGLVYHLAQAMQEFRDSLPEGEEKAAVADILLNIHAIWTDIKNRNARENLLKNLQTWLEKAPSAEDSERIMRVLAASYFVVQGLSLKLSSLGSSQKMLASSFGFPIPKMQELLATRFAPMITAKYEKASLIKNIRQSPEQAWSFIEKNQDNVVMLLLENSELAQSVLDKGDAPAKAFIAGNTSLVTALLRAKPANLKDLFTLDPDTTKQTLAMSIELTKSLGDFFVKDLAGAHALVEYLGQTNQLDGMKPILEINSGLASTLRSRQQAGSETDRFLKAFVRLGSSHVECIKKLGGNIKSSLDDAIKQFPAPEKDLVQKKALQEKCARLQALNQLLALEDQPLVSAFLERYDTQEKLERLKTDLSSLSAANQTNLQRHFDAVFLPGIGSLFSYAYSWMQTTVNPLATGGVPPLAGILKNDVKQALSCALESLAENVQDMMPPFDRRGGTMAEKLDGLATILQGKTMAETVYEQKQALTRLVKNLPSAEALKLVDRNGAMEALEGAENQCTVQAYEKVSRDFDAAFDTIENHLHMVEILQAIEHHCSILRQAGVHIDELTMAFHERIDETIAQGQLLYAIPAPPLVPEKIATMKQSLLDAKNTISVLREETYVFYNRVIEKQDSIAETKAYIGKREKTWAHFFMNLFSRSYANMFSKLKDAVARFDSNQLNADQAITEIQEAIYKNNGYRSDKIEGLKQRIQDVAAVDMPTIPRPV